MKNNIENIAGLKVAVHRVPSITKSGHRCANYPDSLVVIGINPVGPRGGHQGQWVDGKVVGHYKYGQRENVHEHVKKLVADGCVQA
jgi:hypothetical protein